MIGVVLMYHRIVPKADARPWFARGTAVTPEAFAAQMRWLTGRFEVVSLPDLLVRVFARPAAGAARRPLAAITFDDGYADVVEFALPVCRELGVVGAVFPSVSPMEGERQPLWFDAFYALLQARLGSGGDRASELEGASLADWVRGEIKVELQRAAPDSRVRILRRIAHRWGLDEVAGPAYLAMDDLRLLVDRGWTVGGHGRSHSRLTDTGDDEARAEIRASFDIVRLLHDDEAVFAYPDGAHDARIRRLVEEAGFGWALTVAPGPVDHTSSRREVPRYLCRGDDEMPHPTLDSFLRR